MRLYIITLLLAFAVVTGCSSHKKPVSKPHAVAEVDNDTVRIANDSLEYEVIIIDPGFSTWLASRARARGYYGQPYLENKNRLWVMEWNTRAMDPIRWKGLYQMPIDYSANINYGYEVNYLLFNYLVYFQISNNQQLGGVVPQP